MRSSTSRCAHCHCVSTNDGGLSGVVVRARPTRAAAKALRAACTAETYRVGSPAPVRFDMTLPSPPRGVRMRDGQEKRFFQT